MNYFRRARLPCVHYAWFLVQLKGIYLMETEVTVDCHTDPNHMIVDVKTDVPFNGKIYVGDRYNDADCLSQGDGNSTTTIKIPYRGCNTTQKSEGLFMNSITVQQRQRIVSSGDGQYQIGCRMFTGDIQLDTNNSMAVTMPTKKLTTDTMAAPGVLLRIYDFENDVFVETVRLGQVVELEITITDGKNYKGRVSNCDAYGGDGNKVAVVRQ